MDRELYAAILLYTGNKCLMPLILHDFPSTARHLTLCRCPFHVPRTGNSIYAELNRVLRSEDRKAAKKFFNYLRLFMEAMGCMPQQRRNLWRGISADLYDQYEVGKIITWWSVSSCTADESVARNFMQGCGGQCTLITLDCETAVDVSALSFYSNEKESLLAPGTQLEVTKRTKKGNIAEIHVREVGRAMT